MGFLVGFEDATDKELKESKGEMKKQLLYSLRMHAQTPFILLKLIFVAVSLVFVVPSVILFTINIIKTFFKFVHHSNFTSCAFYAALLTLIVGLYVPNQPILIAVALLIGSLFGALVKNTWAYFMRHYQPKPSYIVTRY